MTVSFRPAKREQIPLLLGTGSAPGGRLRKAECTPRPCQVCGETFTPMRRSKGLYCSRMCSQAGIARAAAPARGDRQRGKGEGRTYRKFMGRHEHRVVAEQKLGRPLLPGEIVHHIDGDYLNNDPDNLEVMTQGEHIRRHEIWRARWAR
jgi:hypothetical protein